MKKTLISAVLAATFGLVAMQASASDGTITFNGQITDTDCTVTGGGAATGSGNNITVTLPTVSTAALAADGATAGETAFSLVLGGGTACTNGKTAAMWVETASTSALDASTGALKNINGSATNVQVQMLNGNNSKPILLNVNTAVKNGDTVLAGSNQPAATIAGNTATLNYFGRYLAKGGPSTAGTVSTYLTFSMQYN